MSDWTVAKSGDYDGHASVSWGLNDVPPRNKNLMVHTKIDVLVACRRVELQCLTGCCSFWNNEI